MKKMSFVILSVMMACCAIAMAKTVTETRWQQTKFCAHGFDEDRIVVTRYYSDGTYAVKFMTRDCSSSCWVETAWSDEGSTPSITGKPATVDLYGNWTLHNVSVGHGGDFTVGTGASCRGFTSDPLATTIYIPYEIVGEPVIE